MVHFADVSAGKVWRHSTGSFDKRKQIFATVNSVITNLSAWTIFVGRKQTPVIC